ncbi:MAG: patatin-like phospholipase family protein [Christensenellaceae bacterium]|jgi:NTE family protein|nr:patatin-like phospholipase family protein [Christensenellaceae bacterium]
MKLIKKERKKVGIALGSGGARGFCHIGVIEVLQENNIPIDVVTGCSMGALVAGAVAVGAPMREVAEASERVNDWTVFDVDILGFRKSGGLASGNRAMKLYKSIVGDNLIEGCKIPMAVIATDLKSKSLYTFKSGEVWRGVRASMSIPGVFKPVVENGMVLVDGGVLRRMPIQEARDLGADIVIAVDALGAPFNDINPASFIQILDLSITMMGWNSAQLEYKQADLVIVPDMGSRSQFSFKNNREAIAAGRKAAEMALPKILKLIGR